MTTIEQATRWSCPDSAEILPYGAPRGAWLKNRKAGIGGSDIAAILGMSRWKTARDVWLDKTDQVVDAEVVSWPMVRGTALEDPILGWFSDQTGIAHRKVGMQQHKEKSWMLVNPDALTDDGGLVEVKTTSFWLRDEWADGSADYAVLQGQWSLAVTGRSHLWVIAAVSDDEPVWERHERDEQLIGVMVEAAERFWFEHVQADVEPPLMWQDRETLAGQFSEVTEADPVVGDADLDQWITTRAALAGQIKQLEQAKKQAEAEIINALGDADTLVIDGRIAATRKQQTSRVVDMKAIEAMLADSGDSLDNYRVGRTSRVLRIPDPAKRKEWK